MSLANIHPAGSPSLRRGWPLTLLGGACLLGGPSPGPIGASSTM